MIIFEVDGSTNSKNLNKNNQVIIPSFPAVFSYISHFPICLWLQIMAKTKYLHMIRHKPP